MNTAVIAVLCTLSIVQLHSVDAFWKSLKNREVTVYATLPGCRGFADWFKCSTHDACVHRSMLCDGVQHCGDGSDERPGCSRLQNIECPSARPFQCSNSERCIRRDHVCDSYNDCVDGSDEESCPTTAAVPVPTTTPQANQPTNTRLVDGPNSREGRLEVYHDGRWGTVCDDGFDDITAKVACYSMGFGYNGTVQDVPKYASGSGEYGQIWLDDLRCTLNDTSIHTCNKLRSWGSHDCQHGEDVSIRCIGDSSSDRLPITESGCPVDFSHLQTTGKCYKLVRTALNWTAAGHFCATRQPGAHVVFIGSSVEQRAVRSFLRDQNAPSEPFWIGGERDGTEWLWKYQCEIDGSPGSLPIKYTTWGPNEPNDVGGAEACIALMNMDAWWDFRWNDDDCSKRFAFICEIDI